MKKLFFAIREEDAGMVASILKGNVECRICHDMSSAVAALDASFDLIVCGLHFDDGRMFDLLHHAKADPRTRNTPFIGVKGAGRALTPAIYKSIAIAMERLGAAAFVDISYLILRHGHDHAMFLIDEGLKQLIDGGLLAFPGRQDARLSGTA